MSYAVVQQQHVQQQYVQQEQHPAPGETFKVFFPVQVELMFELNFNINPILLIFL